MEQAQFPYPLPREEKWERRRCATTEEAQIVQKWCTNPLRVEQAIRNYHIWCLKHQKYADEETRQWVKENIEQIKKDLDLPDIQGTFAL